MWSSKIQSLNLTDYLQKMCECGDVCIYLQVLCCLNASGHLVSFHYTYKLCRAFKASTGRDGKASVTAHSLSAWFSVAGIAHSQPMLNLHLQSILRKVFFFTEILLFSF